MDSPDTTVVSRRLLVTVSLFLGVTGIGRRAHAGEVLVNPEPTLLYFLQHALAHTTPPYEELADFDHSVTQADEFHRQAATEAAISRFRGFYRMVSSVSRLTLNLQSQFDEYDPQSLEYDLDINDGTYIPYYNVFGREVRVALTNGNQAQVWKISPSDAAFVLKRAKGNRSVLLNLRLNLLESPAAIPGTPMVINGKVTDYDVSALDYATNPRLGRVVVAP